jgi:hypothetical protein
MHAIKPLYNYIADPAILKERKHTNYLRCVTYVMSFFTALPSASSTFDILISLSESNVANDVVLEPNT